MINYSIIMVNWNSGANLKNSLDSISETKIEGFKINKVVVVDNGSNDNSQMINKKYNFNLCIIQNEINKGFAFACNQGAKICNSDFLLFLNPDTLIYKNTLINLSRFLIKKDEKIGIIGIQLEDDNRNISKTCSRFPKNINKLCKVLGITKIFPSTATNMKEWKHNESRIVDQVIGAFFVVEKSLYDNLKGFDERFFVYYEEVDFSKRASELGKYSYYFTGAKAYHKGGGSSEQVLDKRLYYSLSSFLKYQKKHSGKLTMYITLLIEVLEYFSRFVSLSIKGKLKDLKKLNSAYKMFFKNLRFILTA